MTQSKLNNHTKSLEKSINACYCDLSRRELQCLQISLRGQSARLVADELGISQRTVEEYLNNVKRKLGVASKSEMINVVLDRMLDLIG